MHKNIILLFRCIFEIMQHNDGLSQSECTLPVAVKCMRVPSLPALAAVADGGVNADEDVGENKN